MYIYIYVCYMDIHTHDIYMHPYVYFMRGAQEDALFQKWGRGLNTYILPFENYTRHAGP